jgi:hypothetical protein
METDMEVREMGMGHSGNSPLRSKHPRQPHYDMAADEGSQHEMSQIDFSQYKVSHPATKKQFSKLNYSPPKRPANIGGVEGDAYLNERLKQLEVQRA